MSFAVPIWPWILFGVIEPVLLCVAYITSLRSPMQYFADQAPNHVLSSHEFPPQALGVTLQLGNVMLLLAAMAVICIWTTHPEISKWYLITVACADLGHIYAVYSAVGSEYFFNLGAWNQMIAGNVGVSAFLFVNRLLTVMGTFGTREGKLEKTTSKKM